MNTANELYIYKEIIEDDLEVLNSFNSTDSKIEEFMKFIISAKQSILNSIPKDLSGISQVATPNSSEHPVGLSNTDLTGDLQDVVGRVFKVEKSNSSFLNRNSAKDNVPEKMARELDETVSHFQNYFASLKRIKNTGSL